MVRMIQAHQEGDETTKKEIGNKVKQDRDSRRRNNAKLKRGKSLMFPRQNAQQVTENFLEKRSDRSLGNIAREIMGNSDSETSYFCCGVIFCKSNDRFSMEAIFLNEIWKYCFDHVVFLSFSFQDLIHVSKSCYDLRERKMVFVFIYLRS